MSLLAKNRVLISLAAIVFILIFGAAAIFWARGFKPNFKNGKIDHTGLIVATSIPTGAQVYLDGRLTSATNTNIAFLDPKTYDIKITKDGYTAWEKQVDIKADLATEIKVLLFPTAPEIKPLTATGASGPSLSPDGSKIAYGAGGQNGGLYILPMTDNPFPFRQDVRLVMKNQSGFDFTKAKFIWGPDSKQVIAHFETKEGQNAANLLIDTDQGDQPLRDVTASLAATLTNWQDQLNSKAQPQTLVVPDVVKSATIAAAAASPTPSPGLSSSTQLPTTNYQLNYYPSGLIFSPDEDKVLYSPRSPQGEAGKTKDSKYKVYDLKNKKEYSLPDFSDLINISWFPDSEHLVIAQKDQISVIEIDGTNKMGVYTGKFEDGFVFAHPSGSRLIILTTLTQPEGTPPNLYSINLR